MPVGRDLYDIVVRNGNDDVTDARRNLTRTDTVEFMRSLLRSMDYDEVTVQIHKRIPS